MVGLNGVDEYSMIDPIKLRRCSFCECRIVGYASDRRSWAPDPREVDPRIWPCGGKANRRLAILDTDKKDFELHLMLDLFFTCSTLSFATRQHA